MKLFLVHCGYYDPKVCEGLFESHTNIFVAASSFESAKLEAKKSELFQQFRMHIDGLQEIKEQASLSGESIVLTNRHRDLAPKPATKNS